MADNEVIYIAIAPPTAPDDNLIRGVADILSRSPCGTRHLIAGGIPRIIAHYDNMQITGHVIQKLHNLGIGCFTCLLSPSACDKEKGAFVP
ncbi:MAG: hypothetical protein PHE15_00845 [Dehalococcoidales bacterium]|nr:hypothetical protein [Dehalococcoidales bacterium]